jgi:phosphoribosylamine--glycine ligase
MCLVHKNRFIALPFSQDHKRAFDNDLGPNTGGMGAYCDMPQMDCYDESIERVIKPIINKLSTEQIPFTGFLYAGLMLTKDGIKVIEFNARFGDPECEVILPVLNIDLIETILNLMDESKDFLSIRLSAISKCMGVVIASKGYPEKPITGNEILFPEDKHILVFHAGTSFYERNFVSTGGRVVVIVAIDDDLQMARNKVYNYIDSMKLSDQFFYRKDIGSRALQFLNN